jgi:DNA-binding transcriptional LysR family regulator
MQMQQVHYFLALCEELNFTRAARRCGVSQPTLTIAIGALERELGGALFRRKPSIALTVLGRMVRPHLDEIARNAAHAREVARTLTPRRDADRSARHAVDSSEKCEGAPARGGEPVRRRAFRARRAKSDHANHTISW